MTDPLSIINAKVLVMRKTTTQDADGALVETFQTVAAGVPCYISPVGGSLALQFAAMRQELGGSAVFLPGANVQVGDWFTQSTDPGNGDWYTITAANPIRLDEFGIVNHVEALWQTAEGVPNLGSNPPIGFVGQGVQS